MNKKNKETRVVCPNCGAEFAIPENEHFSAGMAIGKDSGLGTVKLPLANEGNKSKKATKTAQERIEALRNAGVDVSQLFAMTGANGGEHVACLKDGKLSVLEDNDPIFQSIIDNGAIPNSKLFRRWVMSQMFHMLYHDTQFNALAKECSQSITDIIHRKGYDYMWKMTVNEFYAQSKMYGRDDENYFDRNLWFNQGLAVAMTEDYTKKLKKFIEELPVKHCKNVPYVRVNGKNIFVQDLYSKVYRPIYCASIQIRQANNPTDLYNYVSAFNKTRIKLGWSSAQCAAWVDAFKGSGAYFTMQNMIRFHNCLVVKEGVKLSKDTSLAILKTKAMEYKNEGWRMIGFMKKFIKDNNVNVVDKINSWKKR